MRSILLTVDPELEHVPQEVIERPMEEYLKGWISDTRCKGHSNRSNVLASETGTDGFWEASINSNWCMIQA